MDGQNQGRKVEDGEGGLIPRGFAVDSVTRSGVGRERCGEDFRVQFILQQGQREIMYLGTPGTT